jgi:predicted lipid-binding transport protein (Tim44 family)
MFRHRWVIALAAFATALTLAIGTADARVGGGGSFGSRGGRTFSAPSATRTAPSASPIQRSITQPARPSTPVGGASRPGLFGGGLFGGLAAGFLGAGLFGLLFGHGFFGGMGGFASLLGLVLQLALLYFVVKLIFAWFQRRNAPAYAGGPSGSGGTQNAFNPLNAGMFGSTARAGEPVTIGPSDYDAFERLLIDIQTAYSNEDLNALRAHVTPEMLSYFSEQLSENASRGVVNRVTGVRLLQGDLSEAWREGNVEYATVAMRFGLTDSTVERASGRTVEGGSPSEVTEVWTFMRSRGGDWILSAIQQA